MYFSTNGTDREKKKKSQTLWLPVPLQSYPSVKAHTTAITQTPTEPPVMESVLALDFPIFVTLDRIPPVLLEVAVVVVPDPVVVGAEAEPVEPVEPAELDGVANFASFCWETYNLDVSEGIR
jgi:hypothetical protein